MWDHHKYGPIGDPVKLERGADEVDWKDSDKGEERPARTAASSSAIRNSKSGPSKHKRWDDDGREIDAEPKTARQSVAADAKDGTAAEADELEGGEEDQGEENGEGEGSEDDEDGEDED